MSPALFLVASLWGGSSASALTLEEARQIAVERSLQVERALAAADAAHADHRGTISGNLPALAGFVDVSTGAGLTSFGFERPVRTQVGLGMQASWSLLAPADWAAASAARQSARGQVAVARWAMVTARQDATVAYARALSAQEEAEAWRRAQADAAASRLAAESLVAAGLRPPTDAARARADEAASRAAAIEAVGRARARCAELRGLLRLDVAGDCDLAAVSWAEPAAPSVEEHPALTAAQAAREAARGARDAARLDFAPTVDLSATLAEYNVGEGFGAGWSAAAGLDLPLLASGALLQGAHAAQERLSVAEADLADQRIQLEIARVSAAARLDAARAGLLAREEALLAAQTAYDQEDARYREGLSGATDWLTARQQRDLAAVQLAQSRAAVGEALAAVEAALGVW